MLTSLEKEPQKQNLQNKNLQGQVLHRATLNKKPTNNSPPSSIKTENKQLMRNVPAWRDSCSR